MELVALVEPSRGHEPGHMVIAQESADGIKYFGFHFDPKELPIEFQPKERWQEYLINHKMAGFIADDLVYAQRALAVNPSAFLETRVPAELAIEAVLPPREEWDGFADYSFSPDDFHSDASPCYNCVTWAILIGNLIVPGFLKPVRQGRIKLIVRQIRAMKGKAGGSNG